MSIKSVAHNVTVMNFDLLDFDLKNGEVRKNVGEI